MHVGLPKTGTTFLQAVLAEHRDALRDVGVLYPFVRPQAMFLGAVEVRGSREKFGLSAEDVAGAWAALCDRVRGHDGLSVISHEILGGAEPDEIAAALRPLAGVEVDVVVTARDLGRQATAHWQEEVKLGDVRSFADFEREQYRADVPPPATRPHFWHAQDYADALRRWSTAVPAPQVHLVTCPPPGAPPDLLWRRFADACGIPDGLVDPAVVPPANTSLSSEAIALVRAVNRELAGRLSPREHARYVKRDLAEGRLATRGVRRPERPPRWPTCSSPRRLPGVATWRRAGIPCTATWPTSIPCSERRGDPHPDDVPEGVPDPAEVEAIVRDVLRRVAAGRVDSGHEGTGNPDSAAPGRAGRPAGPVERLRRRLGLVRG